MHGAIRLVNITTTKILIHYKCSKPAGIAFGNHSSQDGLFFYLVPRI